MKNGAPSNAVIIPTGISPSVIVLDIKSTIGIKAAPNSIVAGINFLWFSPTINRMACGIIMPTKPIIPLTATD